MKIISFWFPFMAIISTGKNETSANIRSNLYQE